MNATDVTTRMGWGWGLRRSSAAALAFFAIAAGAFSPSSSSGGSRESVVVRIAPGAAHGVEKSIAKLGGTIGRRMGLIKTVEATIPSGEEATLRATRGVVSVTPNARVHLMGDFGYNPTSDFGSLYEISRIVGAPTMWTRGLTGA